MIYFSQLMEEKEAFQISNRLSLGIETIEFAVGMNLDNYRECANQYHGRFKRQRGNTDGILSCHGPFLDLNPASFDTYIADVSRRRYEEAYMAAKIAGSNRLVFHSCFIPSVNFIEGWAERMAEFWKTFLFCKGDMRFSMENLLDKEIEPIFEVWQRVGMPNFNICLDVGHAHCYSNYSVLDWIKKLGKAVDHVHVHDNEGKKDSHSPLGCGNIPWDEVIYGLDKIGVYSITIENNSINHVEQSIEFLKKHFPDYYMKCMKENPNN